MICLIYLLLIIFIHTVVTLLLFSLRKCLTGIPSCSSLLCLNTLTPISHIVKWGNAVGIAIDYGLDFSCSIPVKGKIFLYSSLSTAAVRPTLPHKQWVLRAISSQVELPVRDCHLHLMLRSIMVGLYLPKIFLLRSFHSIQLYRGQFTESGMKEALYILYMHRWTVKNMKCKSLIYILINYYRLRMTNDRPDLSSERAPHRVKTATSRQQPLDRK
jgi:hypothetical protein